MFLFFFALFDTCISLIFIVYPIWSLKWYMSSTLSTLLLVIYTHVQHRFFHWFLFHPPSGSQIHSPSSTFQSTQISANTMAKKVDECPNRLSLTVIPFFHHHYLASLLLNGCFASSMLCFSFIDDLLHRIYTHHRCNPPPPLHQSSTLLEVRFLMDSTFQFFHILPHRRRGYT